jgi:hypothetical protein
MKEEWRSFHDKQHRSNISSLLNETLAAYNTKLHEVIGKVEVEIESAAYN